MIPRYLVNGHCTLDAALTAACRLLSSRTDVRAVHIQVARHPSDDQLRSFQQYAAAHDLSLTMSAPNGIVLRRRPHTKRDLLFTPN